MKLRYSVLGAGAMGSIFGARLALVGILSNTESNSRSRSGDQRAGWIDLSLGQTEASDYFTSRFGY